ncbi:MAG: methyltransferase [Microscillaceae bacterium]
MANTFFQFKQFRVEQAGAAMKVCTDACLFGAWLPAQSATHILDIGTGTGLLALMLAQRTSARLTAIEIDPQAAQQAQANFLQSPWAQRLRLIAGAAQEFARQTTEKFDWIVSNPPFFEKHWLPGDVQKAQAKHADRRLGPEELLLLAGSLLSAEGRLALLYPPYEAARFAQMAEPKGWKPHQRLWVYNQPQKPCFRVMTVYGRENPAFPLRETELFIRDAAQQYTAEFKALLRDFYLIF